jgi:hypothetical protein
MRRASVESFREFGGSVKLGDAARRTGNRLLDRFPPQVKVPLMTGDRPRSEIAPLKEPATDEAWIRLKQGPNVLLATLVMGLVAVVLLLGDGPYQPLGSWFMLAALLLSFAGTQTRLSLGQIKIGFSTYRISELENVKLADDGSQLTFEGRGQRFCFRKVLYAPASWELLIQRIAADKTKTA